MKTLIIFSLLLTVSSAAYSNGYYGPRIHFMPMPDQYKNYSEYRDALEIWKSVAMKRQYDPYRHYYYGGTMTSMPKPDQYKNSYEYRNALEIWKRVAIKQNPIIVEPMPMPDQYKNYSEYRDALSLWQQVYGR